ncbi:putative dehydrogenase [Thalassobacillus pellis]|nr:putative dehydrogenase [Thalassobacillus pellis]
MDWGPYDFATLHDILGPASLEINTAWTARPRTGADPADCVFDVETHVGASITCRNNGQNIHIHYERASCAHGEGYVRAEIEGTLGSFSWTPFDSKQPVFRRYDKNGQLVTEEIKTGPRSEFTIFDNPLLHFYRKVTGQESHANVNRDALANFSCIPAIYKAADTGKKQTITY